MNVLGLLRSWLAGHTSVPQDSGRHNARTSPQDTAEQHSADIDQAITLHESGRLNEAEAIYRRILARDPDHAQALHLCGVAQHQRGDQRAALASIDAAIAASPQTALFHFNRGNVLNALGEAQSAIASFETATRLDARHMPSWLNLGRTHMQMAALADHAKAAEALWQAFHLDAEVPGLRFELATALIAFADRSGTDGASGNKRLHGEAAGLLAHHWQEAPDPLGARLMLAHALEEQSQLTAAAEHFRAVAENPAASAEARRLAHGSLANCCNRLGLMPEALKHYRAVMDMTPAGAPGLSDTASAIATGLAYDPTVTPQMLLDGHRDWARRFAPALPVTDAFAHVDRSPDRPLRIGYVSPDLRRHPVTSLFAATLEQHDSRSLEVFCYYNFAGADEVTARIRRASQHWRDVIGKSDSELAQMIRDDRIEILVDLAGHTTRNRLPALAMKPAPVMVEWLGYYCTTGIPAFDWFITDPWNSPAGQESWFTEKLYRLPHTRFCYEPYPFMPAVSELPALKNGHITFGCLNNLSKLNNDVLTLWAGVMRQAPGSRLIIQAQALDDAPNRERFATQAAACGLPMPRVDLRGFVALDKAAHTYHEIDIALDPFPFCGGMTSLESLWMGVPVVTLEQPLVAGRQTLSMLHNVGMEDCITANREAYVELATRLASETARLSATRAALRARVQASPLMDYAGFARDLEAAYRHMWRAFVTAG